MITKQEAFNRAWQYFIKERHNPSTTHDHWSCLYRSPTGMKCAVGLLIPNEEYSRDFEGMPLEDVFDQVPTLCDSPDLSVSYLRDLQQCHDEFASSPSLFHTGMENKMRALAIRWNLSLPEGVK